MDQKYRQLRRLKRWNVLQQFVEDVRIYYFFGIKIKKKLHYSLKYPKQEENDVQFIFNLLKAQYHNFSLDVTNINSWTDVSQKDLLAVTSLLLHHTCITDRHEEITSPLCCKLPQAIQFQIKHFLENVNLDITREKMETAIDLCVKLKEELSLSDSSFHTVYEVSPLYHQSPLQGLLTGTPKSKRSMLFEKEREIKQLKNDLELERYEKADLQEELKSYQQQIDGLSKYLFATTKRK